MKRFIIMIGCCFLLSGCGLVSTLISPFKATKNTLPQQTEKSKIKIVCAGNYETNEEGEIISCDKGFYSYSENFVEKERRFTLKERVVQFIQKFFGWSILIAVMLAIFSPLTLVSIFTWIINKQKKVITQIVTGVQNAKDKSPDLITALNASTDEAVKKFISQFKLDNNIK